MWIMIDGRAPWVRKGHPTERLGPGSLLLRWRGVGGHLELKPGCFIRGIEFDIADRPRQPHPQYGWEPVPGSGGQPSPKRVFGRNPPHLISGNLATQAERLMERVVTRWWRGGADQLPCNLQLAGWLAELADFCLGQSSNPIERAERFARRALAKGCSVTAMAREAGMPASTFCEHYQSQRGISPGIFLRQCRMHQAATDLIHSHDTISRIGKRCGYHNAASFARTFKQCYRMSPREYRLNHRQ
jgi:AraC family mar-sox-rob regulon transcriptional activator